MSGFRLEFPHLHACYSGPADDECRPGCLLAMGRDGKLCLATSNKKVVGLCCEDPDPPNEDLAEAARKAGLAEPEAPKERRAFYRLLGDGVFFVHKPKKDKPRDLCVADDDRLAKLSRDCDDIEPCGAGEADFIVHENQGRVWRVQLVLERRRV